MIYLLKNATKEFDGSEYKFDTLLPTGRKEKVNRYKRLNDRMLSRKAYFLLMYALYKEYGFTCELADFPELAVSDNGKPFLPAFPEIHFNFAHTDAAIICSISKDETGVDVEIIARTSDLHFADILSPKEFEFIDASPNSNADFTAIWTLKEAYGKFIGSGLLYDFKRTLFLPEYNSWKAQEDFFIYTSKNADFAFSIVQKEPDCIHEVSNQALSNFMSEFLFHVL